MKILRIRRLFKILYNSAFLLIFIFFLIYFLKTLKYSQSKPNIILIVLESTRADHVSGINRESPLYTKNIDNLGKKGVVFTNAISQGPFTRSAMGSIFTGLYPSEHKGYEGLLSEKSDILIVKEAKDIFTILHTLGYRTFCMSQSYSPRLHGIQYVEEIEDIGIDPKTMVNRAIDFLKSASFSSPYFLYMHFIDAHRPYDTALLLDNTLPKDPICEPYDSICRRLPLNIAHSKYSLEIKYLDEQLGRFFSALENSRYFKNNILILTSDHGEYFNDRSEFHTPERPIDFLFFLDHGFSLYQELIHVPLIIVAPKIFKPGRIITSYVETRWLFSMIAERAGYYIVNHIKNYNNRINEIINKNENKMYYCLSEGVGLNHMISLNMGIGEIKTIISSDGSKLIYDVQNDKVKLFNLKSDPMEKNDLATIMNYKEKINILTDELKNHLDLSKTFKKVPKIQNKSN